MEIDKDKVKIVKEFIHYRCNCNTCLEVDVTDTPFDYFNNISFRCPHCGQLITLYDDEKLNKKYRYFD